jgi:2-C-methyl-D-erythritol 4-phosphate cytidylyltransferase
MATKVAVLIPAAGASKRFKGQKKKQFMDMDGRAVFLRAIEQFAGRDDVAQIVMAIPAEDEELFQIKWGASLGFHGVKVILRGPERYETVAQLLAQVKEGVELVALHDAVRPCVTKEMIDAVFAAAARSGAALLAAPLAGTIKRVGADGVILEPVDRSQLWEAQTPQVFRLDLIRKALAERDRIATAITDDAQLVEAIGLPVTVVASDASNIKITSHADLVIAESILKSRPKPKEKGPRGPFAEAEW